MNNPNVSYSWILDHNFESNKLHDKTLRKIFDGNSETPRIKTFVKKDKNRNSLKESDNFSKLKQLLPKNTQSTKKNENHQQVSDTDLEEIKKK